MKLINENLSLKEQLNDNKNLIETKSLDELFENIKQIAINFQNFKKINKIGIDNDNNNFFKKIFEPINGKNENLSTKDKIDTINKFNTLNSILFSNLKLRLYLIIP